MAYDVNQDPYDVSATAEPPSGEFDNHYWGQLYMSAGWFAWQKGESLPNAPIFDPQIHNPDHARPLTHVEVVVFPESDRRFNVGPKTFFSDSKEWKEHGRKSLIDLGIRDFRTVDQKFVHVETVPSGRTYEKNGEKKEATTPEFRAVFDTREEALAAMHEHYGTSGGNVSAPANGAAPTTSAVKEDAQRQMYLAFVKDMWAKMDSDIPKFAAKLKSTPKIGEMFSVTDPDILALMGKDEMEVLGALT